MIYILGVVLVEEAKTKYVCPAEEEERAFPENFPPPSSDSTVGMDVSA